MLKFGDRFVAAIYDAVERWRPITPLRTLCLARPAAEEGPAECCLEQANLMADCGWRQSQLVRGRF